VDVPKTNFKLEVFTHNSQAHYC